MAGIGNLIKFFETYIEEEAPAKRRAYLQGTLIPAHFDKTVEHAGSATIGGQVTTVTIKDSTRLSSFAAQIFLFPVNVDYLGNPTGHYGKFWTKKASYALAVCRPAYGGPLFLRDTTPPIGASLPPVDEIGGMEDWLQLNDIWADRFYTMYESRPGDLKNIISNELSDSKNIKDKAYANYLINRFW